MKLSIGVQQKSSAYFDREQHPNQRNEMRSLILAALAFCLIGNTASAQTAYRPGVPVRPGIAVGEPHPATPNWNRPRPPAFGIPSLYRPPVIGFGFAPYGYDEFGFPLTTPLGFGFSYTPSFGFAVPLRPTPRPYSIDPFP